MVHRVAVGVVVLLVLSACGGGDGSPETAAALSSFETALIGSYVLVAFDVRVGGQWFDENDFTSFGGDLTLGADRSVFRRTAIQGIQALASGNWRADQHTITAYNNSDGSPEQTATYVLMGGDMLSWDFTDPATGNREIDFWQRQ